jgi:small subunit ribosomal protein S8
MSMSDPLANMLAAIKNGQMANKTAITVPASKLKKAVLRVLSNEGYIRNFEETADKEGKPAIKIELKYFEGKPVIKALKRISSPGRRIYTKFDNMPRIYNGLGVVVVSTSKGVISDFEARQQKIGGELLCSVY